MSALQQPREGRGRGQTRATRRLDAIVELTRGPRVLNVGAAGNALPAGPDDPLFLHGALVRAGLSTLGTEVDPEGLDWLLQHNFEAVRLDAEDLGDGERFDSIVAGELIEHLANPGRFLFGCLGRLNPGGRVVLSTPQPFAPAHVLLHLLRTGSWNPEHTCWFDEQTLRQLLERYGFEIEEVRYVNDDQTQGSHLGFRAVIAVGAALSAFLPRRFRTTLVVAATMRS